MFASSRGTPLEPRNLNRLAGALGGIRTPNLLIRSQMLYPLSYERWRPIVYGTWGPLAHHKRYRRT